MILNSEVKYAIWVHIHEFKNHKTDFCNEFIYELNFFEDMYLNSLENLCFCCFCSIVLQGHCKDAQSPWVGLCWAGSQPFPAHDLNAAARHLVHSRDRWEEEDQRPCSDSLYLELHRLPCRLRVPHPQRCQCWQLVLGAHNWLSFSQFGCEAGDNEDSVSIARHR